MLRGTRVIFADEADRFVDTVDRLRRVARAANYREVILPALWSLETFRQKLGDELTGQMWTFKDKGDRDVCLIPEATEVVRELYRGWWAKSLPKPVRVFYAARCYRYERPQAGRYREFTQFGVEVLGGDPEATAAEVVALLHTCLAEFAVPYEFSAAVKRLRKPSFVSRVNTGAGGSGTRSGATTAPG